jgi:hypothetical protein
MVALLLFLLSLLGWPFKSKSCLAAENAALRQQVIVLQRKILGRPEFTDHERLFSSVSSTDQRNTYLKPRTWSASDVSSGWVYSSSERGALGALEEG